MFKSGDIVSVYGGGQHQVYGIEIGDDGQFMCSVSGYFTNLAADSLQLLRRPYNHQEYDIGDQIYPIYGHHADEKTYTVIGVYSQMNIQDYEVQPLYTIKCESEDEILYGVPQEYLSHTEPFTLF